MLDEDEVLKTSYRVHNILLNATTAEANTVVRRCPGENGFLAWKRLCTSLNPRTLGSGVKAINQVLNPIKITEAKKMDMAIEAWEDKISKLATEYGEQLSNKVKLAAMYGMLPK